MALVSGLLAGIMLPDPREKSRTGLIPCKGFFFINIFFTEAQQKQTDSSLSYYPGEFFSLSGGEKITEITNK